VPGSRRRIHRVTFVACDRQDILAAGQAALRQPSSGRRHRDQYSIFARDIDGQVTDYGLMAPPVSGREESAYGASPQRFMP